MHCAQKLTQYMLDDLVIMLKKDIIALYLGSFLHEEDYGYQTIAIRLLALVQMGIKCGACREVIVNSTVCKILVWLLINNRLVFDSAHSFLEHIVYLMAKEHPLLVLVH